MFDSFVICLSNDIDDIKQCFNIVNGFIEKRDRLRIVPLINGPHAIVVGGNGGIRSPAETRLLAENANRKTQNAKPKEF